MYEAHAITEVTDVPTLVGSFAAAIGFETDLTVPTQPVITRPQGFGSNSSSNSAEFMEDALQWRITAAVAGSTRTVRCEVYDESSNSAVAAVVNSYAEIISPITPTVKQPTTLHLVGGLLPEPFIAVVLEYPNGEYRHLYIGHMEKIGDYQGGEVIAANSGPGSSNTENISYRDTAHMHYLFGAYQTRRAEGASGGVHVSHADNADPWRTFRGASGVTNPYVSFPTGAAIGGFNDAINDGYLARARSQFAGQQVLVPINLYVNENIIGDTIMHPIGRPAGVRLVNMQDLQPNQEIVVGGLLWRVFPSHSRRFQKTMPKTGSGAQFRDYESSYYVGYAYFVGDEDSNSAGA